MKTHRSLGAIILAAGHGKRMRASKVNKVAMHLAGKPLILHSVDVLKKMEFGQIVVVVGFAEESVQAALKNTTVIFAQQKKRLGTAHAVGTAIPKIDSSIKDVLVIQGDDSHLYTEETISNLINAHISENADLTLLTVVVKNPFGLGRVVRNKEGKMIQIVEEKDANGNIRKINEINPACYVFDINFLKKYLPEIKKSNVTHEYYLTSLIDIAIKNNKKIETVGAGAIPWRGINTKEELEEAEKLHTKHF